MRELSAIFFFLLLAINLILKAAEGEGGGFRAHPRWPLPQSCLLDNALCIIYNSQIFGRSILIWIPLLSDVAITIIEAIIQLSQEAIVIRPTVERKGDGTGQWFTCMAHIHWVSLNHYKVITKANQNKGKYHEAYCAKRGKTQVSKYQVTSVCCDWLRGWHEFSGPIVERSVA